MKKLIVIAVAVLVLLGAGGGGAWWWLQRAGAAEGAEAPKAEAAPDPSDSGVVALEPFLVNLADKDSPRFLRVTLRLIVADKRAAAETDEDEVAKVRVRSAILELLTEQTSDQLVTPEGKAALKKAIIGRSGQILTEAKVVDVLFSEFVVQF